MDHLHEECYIKLEEVNRIIAAAADDINKAPKGVLHVSGKGNSVQYYKKEEKGTSRQYIRKSDIITAKQLAQKAYANKVLHQALEDKKILDKALAITDTQGMIHIFNQITTEKQKLITPYVLCDRDFILKWEQEQLLTKTDHEKYIRALPSEENAIITEKGEIVRSKSEKILADKFLMMQIPYIYEVPLYLNGYGYVVPDFTVLNLRTRKTFYWEHLGLMDQEDYCNKAIKKIETYERNGIYPGNKLILSYETSCHTVNPRIIEGLVKEYLE